MGKLTMRENDTGATELKQNKAKKKPKPNTPNKPTIYSIILGNRQVRNRQITTLSNFQQ